MPRGIPLNNMIGIGLITCNRLNFFQKSINSIPEVDKIVVVNDGASYPNSVYPSKISEIIQHKTNKGIAKTKNDALKYLLNSKCNHIFLMEDDVAIKEPSVIENYIRASQLSGILHLNYAYHGRWNRSSTGKPQPRLVLNYGENINLAFHYNLTGALSYFRSNVLHAVGLMDETYKNVLEHVDHTYQIIKNGFHPPFRWFADIENSFNSIIELDPYLFESVNSKSFLPIKFRTKLFSVYFRMKNGYKPFRVPTVDEDELRRILEEIKRKYACII